MRSFDTTTDPLLEAIEMELEGPDVVAIGGGHGLAQVLGAIQLYTPNVTAVVGVADDGGSSGRLSPALKIPPPGDVRRALLALTPDHSTWTELFSHRFDRGDVSGHSLGNLILAALTAHAGSFEDGILEAERCLGSIGHVVPVANAPLTLRATVDGETVEGQLAIAGSRGAFTALDVLPPDLMATERAIAAIADADQIVLGPGSLFTSTIAAVRVNGIADAVNASDGQLVYVCNLITQDGETLYLDGPGHIEALTSVGGLRSPDVIVVNDGPIKAPAADRIVRFDSGEVGGARLVTSDLVDRDIDWPHHHPNRLAAVLSSVVPS